MKRVIAMLQVLVIVSISSIPLLPPEAVGNGVMTGTLRPACHMKMASMDHAKHAMTLAMRHCRIECCGHHDIYSLPHLLGPHVVSQTGFGAGLAMTKVADAGMPVLKPRLLPFPVPPPRIS